MIISRIFETFFSKKLDFRVRLFNVLAMAGTLTGAVMTVTGVATNAGADNVITNIAGAVISFGLLVYSYRSGRYKRCYILSIVAIFLILFPVLFFSAAGYHSGMPSFFIFAVCFTVFMLEGGQAVFFSVLEVAVYFGLCLYAYLNPEHTGRFATETEYFMDVVVGFVVVSAAVGATMFIHFRMYNEQQRELEKARQRLAEENAALEQINRLKTEFLGNVSHELKTPLTVVSGYAQSVRRQLQSGKADSERMSRSMKLISSEAERLAMMVSQVLDAARIEEGCMFIDRKPCRADEIIHAAVNTHYPILNKNQNQLDIRIDGDLPEILADPARISQVVVNLISNAVRFTANGRITVSAKTEGWYVTVSVSDTGKGISPARLPFIFDRYNNNQKSVGGQDTGTGLGLYICKYIMDVHGGTITVESAEGKGTTVRFTVPIA